MSSLSGQCAIVAGVHRPLSFSGSLNHFSPVSLPSPSCGPHFKQTFISHVYIGADGSGADPEIISRGV